MIHKCYLTREGFLPLCAYTDNSSFKIYMVDTGLLCSKFRIPANIIKNSPHGFDGFKGALVENYIMQSLCANGLEPYYWTSPGKAELDFLFQDAKGNIIPVEVKSADHVRSKSLHTFCKNTQFLTHIEFLPETLALKTISKATLYMQHLPFPKSLHIKRLV